ncbi:hypothetical protein [Actinomadura sp. CNU-125]|uniref:hypothetical protein n=1 Tax=Actinomadura sp. CNU-125 TaxID=1904961 RepID=UPI0013019801|nr:hypothetical protein [Actinomadura sp. CNU-125]
MRHEALRAHESLLEATEAGDRERAEEVASAHLSIARDKTVAWAESTTIRAAAVARAD